MRNALALLCVQCLLVRGREPASQAETSALWLMFMMKLYLCVIQLLFRIIFWENDLDGQMELSKIYVNTAPMVLKFTRLKG